MSDRLTHTRLRALALHEDTPSVSIYLPTHRAGRDIAQDPIRLKNLLRSAKSQLESTWGARATEFLSPLWMLVENSSFWRSQLDGLALLASDEGTNIFELPDEVEEAVHVTTRYHLTPLIDYLGREPHFYVLDLSVNRVRLLKGSAYGLEEVPCPDLPSSIDEVVPEGEPSHALQSHSGSRGSAIFHGHGSGEETQDEGLTKFFTTCDRATSAFLRNESAPLFLNCVDQHAAAYRRINTNPRLLDVTLSGNPYSTSDKDLHKQCLDAMKAIYEESERNAAAQYRKRKAEDKATDQLPRILTAANEGRVESLWVPRGRPVLGVWNAERAEVQVQPHNGSRYDLLDYAATQTYLSSGNVYTVAPDAMPDQGPAAAAFRY